ncbi:MAG TPA: DUF4058 family protein [Gemmataceae bacterium]|nr:DUF4058 family protein [Gemmataceae bacterium]
MQMPFPGMDPYLEHPVLWESVHHRLIISVANQLQPRLDPRYVASIEERVYIEGPQRRIPEVWIQKTRGAGSTLAVAESETDAAVVLEVDDLEVHETRVEILDVYNNMKLVAIIEVVSPTNKAAGPGRESYLKKQAETLARDCHLVEIDLLRRGQHVLSIPQWRAQALQPYNYLICVSRWPARSRFELYPCPLNQRLPRIRIPLTDSDPDAALDIQAALEQVYSEGRYMWRVRYEDPCEPPLPADTQQWANERWAAYRAARSDLFEPKGG